MTTEEHGTLQAFGVIFAMWVGVFFGVWVLPIAENTKILLDVLSSVGFVIFGLLYFMVKGKIPFPRKELMERVIFWLGIISCMLQAMGMFALNVILWEVVEINGILVVTYIDLISLIFGIMGVSVIAFMIWYIFNRNPYRKTDTKKIVNWKLTRNTSVK